MTVPVCSNEPGSDFSIEPACSAMIEALRSVASQLGSEFSPVIGGKRVTLKEKATSTDPSQKDQVVAVCQSGTVEHVEEAIAAAGRAFATWSRVSAEERAAILLRAADRLRKRKFWAAAWQVYEVGKNWAEADGDVAETIDHLEFFAREALRYARGQVMAPHSQEFSDMLHQSNPNPGGAPLLITVIEAASSSKIGRLPPPGPLKIQANRTGQKV